MNLKTTINITLILCAGALFGFFYTMSISIMPGLDLTQSYSAITANQEIGHATQNYYFATPMIGTLILCIILISLHFKAGHKTKATYIAVALLAFAGMIAVTLMLNVPLNQILDGAIVTPEQPNLNQVWDAYSIDWQGYNWLRTLLSGLTLLFATLAITQKRVS